jgi:radical SAM protein with 4Fe4S-binding SPASM domain
MGLTNYCNTHCTMCYRHGNTGNWPKFFPVDVLQKIVNEAGDRINILEFSGIGEPLLHPEFKDCVRIARSKIKVHIVSNGGLLDEKTSHFITDQGVSHVWFSLNSTTQEVHDIVMPGLDFERIVSNIRYLSKLPDRPSIKMTFVMTKDNYHQALAFPQFAFDLGADEARIGCVDAGLSLANYEANFTDEIMAVRTQIERMAKKDSRITCIPAWGCEKIHTPPGNARGINCPNAQREFGIYSTSGSVVPCCYAISTPEIEKQMSYGNIYEQSISEIWNGQKANAFRQSLKRIETSPQICKECNNYWGKTYISDNVFGIKPLISGLKNLKYSLLK